MVFHSHHTAPHVCLLITLSRFFTTQATIRAVRNARAEYNVEPGRRIAATIVARTPALQRSLSSEAPVLAALAKLDPASLSAVAEPPATGAEGCVELVVSEEIEVLLPLAGLFDAAKERARLAKQEAKLDKELAALEGRLRNKGFVDKAPAAVVAEVEAAAAELRGKLEAVAAKMAQLPE